MASTHSTKQRKNVCSHNLTVSTHHRYPEHHQIPYYDPRLFEFPSQILPFMFLGDSKDSKNRRFLAENRITHILNVTVDEPNCFEDEFEYLKIAILDTPNQNIAMHFDKAHEFIERARTSGGNILVHCYAGISRSATIVISYLIKTQQMTAENALQFVKLRRPIISPNISFNIALINYSHKLNGTL